MNQPEWLDIGSVEELSAKELQTVRAGRTRLAVTCRNGTFSAISAVCNHVGGPLGEGRMVGEYVECPWHYWKFHHATGLGEPGYEADAVPAYPVRVEQGRVLVDLSAATPRQKSPHPPHPLARTPRREPGPIRVFGLSTTAMTEGHPRFSTSDALLEDALAHASAAGCETRQVRLRDLTFRACEGFYSKSARACT